MQGTEGSEGPAALTVAALSGTKEHYCVPVLFALQKRYQKKLQSVFNVCTNYAADNTGSSVLEQVMTLSAATF